MEDSTSVLFDLDGFGVVSVTRTRIGAREVVVAGVDGEQACPGCGVLTDRVHSRWSQPIKDLPYGRPLLVRWRKRRFGCHEQRCPRRTFTERSEQIGPGQRLTRRLRERLEAAVSGSARSVPDVAREYGVWWWSVHQALVARAAAVLGPAPTGVRWLGVDETRARSVRWLLTGAGWRRSEPWMTSFVALDPTHPAGLLGLAPGRSGAAVEGWLAAQTPQFRAGIEVVAVDPSAPFAAALRRLLPHAVLVVDHWHLDRLANLMVTEVRQRATRERLGHRGRAGNDVWAYRRLLLRDGLSLSRKQWRRLRGLFDTDDPTGEIAAAWAGKELLRQLLAEVDGGARPYEIRARLDLFYRCAAEAHGPELTRLATTIETWWPAVEAFLRLRITNARTKGYNRTIKQIKRVACGFRNQANYEMRILLHNAALAA